MSLKLLYDGEHRRIPLEFPEKLNYKELQEKTLKVFPYLKDIEIGFCWKDEDGDEVTLHTDEELRDAIQYAVRTQAAVVITGGIGQLFPTSPVKNTSLVMKFSVVMKSQACSVESQPSTQSIHIGVRCDGCGMFPIVGVRYKCSQRFNFDLCEVCESNDIQPYPMIKIYHSKQQPLADLITVDMSNQIDSNLKNHHHTVSIPPFPVKEKSADTWHRGMTPPMLVAPIVRDITVNPPVGGNDSIQPQEKPKPKAKFIFDVTMVDGTAIVAGEKFMKIWRCMNDGVVDWPFHTKLVPYSGDDLQPTVPSVNVLAAKAGEEVDIAMELTAPLTIGRYTGYFRLQSPDGSYFGHRLWAGIKVIDKDEYQPATASSSPATSPPTRSYSSTAPAATCITLQGEVISPLGNSSANTAVATVHGRFVEVDETQFEDTRAAIHPNTATDLSMATDLWKHIYSAELKVLHDMGFDNVDVMIPLLKEYIPSPVSASQVTNSQPSVDALQQVVLSLLLDLAPSA